MTDVDLLLSLYKDAKNFQHKHELTLDDIYNLCMAAAVLCMVAENDKTMQEDESRMREVGKSILNVMEGADDDSFN